jgi:hypothetical protein
LIRVPETDDSDRVRRTRETGFFDGAIDIF